MLTRSASYSFFFVTILISAGICLGESQRIRAFTKWICCDDFHNGITSWMSYPLAQDVGYDPSIYVSTENGRAVLVRDVIAQGENPLRFGMIRPLSAYVRQSSHFQLEYSLEVGGRLNQVLFHLAARDGHKFTVLLPTKPGYQRIHLTGKSFGLTERYEIEAISIEAIVNDPILGSHNKMTLLRFELQAERPSWVALARPHLILGLSQQVAISNEIVTRRSPLRIQLTGPYNAVLSLYDPSGAKVLQSSFTNAIEYAVDSNRLGLWTAQVQSGTAQTEFKFLVLGSAPPHPRILLSAQRLKQLKTNGRLRELIHRRAQALAASIRLNTAVGENIRRLSTVSVLAGLPQYFAVLETYSNTASLAALDYVLNQNERALKLAEQVLRQISRWPTWTPPWFAAHGLHTYYETGIFTQRLALTYDLIAHQLDQHDKLRLAAAFLHNSIQPVLDDYFVNDRLPIAASNHMAHSVGGAIAACIAMAGDVPDWEQTFAPKLGPLLLSYELLLKNLFPGDGSEAEPAGYENFALQGMSWGVAALTALNIHPHGLQNMLQAFWWERYVLVRPDLVLDTGDFADSLGALTGFAWGAEYAHDPSLRAFYETATHTSSLGVFKLKHTGRALESAAGLLDLVCCTGSLSKPPSPPPSRIFPLRGSAVLRSGWSDTDTVISLRAGPWFNHEHHDQGSFQVAAFGQKLIDEAGYTDYYKDPEYSNYFTQVPAHNSVIIDGDPFSQGNYDGRYWTALQTYPNISRHIFSSNIDYVVASLAPAYKAKLNYFTREYLFLKPTILLIRDSISATTRHQYTWLVHGPPGSKPLIHGNQATITTANGAAAAFITVDRGVWNCISQPIPITAYDNFEHGKILSRYALKLDTWQENTHIFNIAFQFVQIPNHLKPPHWTTTANGITFRTFIANSVSYSVNIRRTAGPLTLEAISTDGDILAIVHKYSETAIFASHAHMLRNSTAPLLASTSPVDVTISIGPTLETISLNSPSRAQLTLSFPKRVTQILTDDKPVTKADLSKQVLFLSINVGHHVIQIRY